MSFTASSNQEKEWQAELERLAATPAAETRRRFDDLLIYMTVEGGYRFYSHVIAQSRVEITPEVGYAAMEFRDYRPVFHVGPLLWMSYLNLDQRVAIAVHEVEHFMRRHMRRFKRRYGDALNQEVANIAADMEINQFIRNIPVDPDQPLCGVHHTLYKLPEGLSAEDYYERLIKKMPKPKHNDVSHNWTLSDGTDGGEIIENTIVDGMIRRAQKAAGHGDTPNHIEALLIALGKSRISWGHILRMYIGSLALALRRPTWLRPNRRGRLDVAGKTRRQGLNVWFAVDTSGSMDSEDIGNCLAEMVAMAKLRSASLTILHADADVAYQGKIRKISDIEPKRFGNGGTDFRPVFDAANQSREAVDLLVYFTDGVGTYPESQPDYPVIWLMVDSHAPQVSWGRSLRYNHIEEVDIDLSAKESA